MASRDFYPNVYFFQQYMPRLAAPFLRNKKQLGKPHHLSQSSLVVACVGHCLNYSKLGQDLVLSGMNFASNSRCLKSSKILESS